MGDPSRTKEEYEIQLFGFHARELQESQRSLIETHTRTVVDELADSLILAAPTTPQSTVDSCRASCAAVTSSIMASRADVIQKMNTLIERTFSISDRSVLPEHHLIAKHAITAEEELALDRDFERLTKEFKERVQYINTLDAEMKIYQILEPSIARQTALMDRVDQMLQNDIGVAESKQLLEAMQRCSAEDMNIDS